MARPSKPGMQSAKEQAPIKAPEAELEEESEKSDLEREHQRDQNLYGNAAMSALMGVSVAGASVPRGPGHGVRGTEEEISGDISYGGEDDDIEGPLTLEELTRSWNPKARRGEDAIPAQSFSLWEDLPATDSSFLEEIRSRPRPALADGLGDALYQPTAESVATGLSSWSREVRRWCEPTVARRTLLRLIGPPAAFLQDPGGRAVFSRGRAGAIATCILLDRTGPESPSNAAFTQFCLELSGSGMRVQQVWNAAESGDAELPMARDLVAASLPATTHRVRPAALSSIAQQRMVDTLVRLADLTSPRGFIPVLQSVESPEGPDDPLGIDDVLAKFTGAIERADRATYDTGGRAAMGMAALCAHSRIRYAGVSVAIGAASSHWSRGSPTANLLDINAKLDRDIQHSLKLLIDVAQHARGRNVALKGLRNGLKRAARFIERARTAAANRMASLIGGILLPDPVVEPEFEIPADALSAAWEDGTPQLALEVLETWPDSLERRVALTLTRAVLANDPRVSVAELGELSSEIRGERPMLSAAVDVCLGGCAIWANDIDTALTVAARQRALGRTRRNGMILATGALTEMSVFELRDGPDRARAVRIDAGAELFHMGATAGLSLLARWAPTED